MRVWARVRFDVYEPHRAYLDPDESWNGYACPWFERDEALKMNDWLFDEELVFDEETDTFLCMDGDEVIEAFRGEDVDGMPLYPIGRGIWGWSLSE